MKFLNREEILNRKDIVTEAVYVPQWDGYVNVKSLTGRERDAFERSIIDSKGKGRNTKTELRDNIRARLVALSVVDEKGERVFKTADVEALGEKNAGAIDAIFSVAQRLSKLTEEDVEELAENFTETENDSSISS